MDLNLWKDSRIRFGGHCGGERVTGVTHTYGFCLFSAHQMDLFLMLYSG